MKKLSLVCIFLILAASFAMAQFNFQALNCSNLTGTYTDLGTQGTAITVNRFGAPISYDDDVSGLRDIGFTFTFNGLSFTKFYLSSNGFIKLANVGTLAPDSLTGAIQDYLTAPDSNLIAPFSFDLDAGAGIPEYRVFTSGAIGSKVCVIQYKNVRDFTFPPQYANINFQIKLYEGSGLIEFVYGTFQSSLQTPSAINAFTGVKGNTDINSVNVTKSSGNAWSTAGFIDGPYGSANKFNNRNNALPDAGRTFRFVSTPPPANDAEVQYVYTLGEIPLIFGANHVVSALIKNKGTDPLNNLSVNLNISGSNSFTSSRIISSLAPGSSVTVSFDPFTPLVAGTNNVSVSVPSDANTSNNLKIFTQLVTANTYSYADNSPVAGSVGGTNDVLILTRYFMSGSGKVTNVSAHISTDGRNFGKTIYAVVLNNLGAVIDSSASYVIQTADFGAYKTFNIITPNTITNSFFYVGIAMKQQAGDIFGYEPISYQDEGNPTRSLAYYAAPINGGVPQQTNLSGRFMIKAVVNSSIVPVNMRMFSAVKNGNVNDLRWETSAEINVSKYIVERSERGNSGFVSIGSVSASQASAYSYTDLLPLRGMNFYRVRAVDMDGRETISEIRSVRNEGRNEMMVYPNPVRDRMNISAYSETGGEAVIMISNAEGRRLYIQKFNLPAGRSLVPVDSFGLPAGVYNVELLTAGERQVQLIIKE